MYEFEFEPEVKRYKCDCCDEENVLLTRYVIRDGSPHTIYRAALHPRSAKVMILAGFGDWGEASSPQRRTAFCFSLWAESENYNVTIEDDGTDFWQTEFYGRILPRDEALEHPLLQLVFDLSDEIFQQDKQLIEFLDARPVDPGSPTIQ